MQANHLYIMLSEGVTTIRVQFDSNGRNYTYLAHKTHNIKAGDIVVVEDALGDESTGYKLAKVTSVDDFICIDTSSTIRYKTIVQKVDCDAYKARCEHQKTIENQLNQAEAQRKANEAVRNYCEQTGIDIGELRGVVNNTGNLISTSSGE